MSDDMIERVAKAMKDRCGILIAESFWCEMARVAVEAMRQPTTEMIEAGAMGIDNAQMLDGLETGRDFRQDDAMSAYQAMIDAVLTSSSQCTR